MYAAGKQQLARPRVSAAELSVRQHISGNVLGKEKRIKFGHIPLNSQVVH